MPSLPPDVQVRPIEPGAELADAWRLGALAFGAPLQSGTPPPGPTELPAGRIWYGAFDRHGRLIGTAEDLFHEQWWGGRRVMAADVAGVAVLAEARGNGAARALLKTLLQGAYERGAAVSALYPTAGAVYRASGWATCGHLRTVDLPTAMLSAGRPGGSKITVRAADPSGADQPAVAELYTKLARSREGLLTRQRPPAEPSTRWPGGIDGITLAEADGELVGYASYTRGKGYRSDALLEVNDLLAATPDAARELIAVLASWRSVTPTVRIRPLDFDAATAWLPWESGSRRDARPWMHRPVDITRAVSSRGWPLSRRGRISFHLIDPVAPWNDGGWELDIADGHASLKRTGSQPDLWLHVGGFALLYCGAANGEMLREAGLLHGPAGSIRGVGLLRPESPAQLLDYF